MQEILKRLQCKLFQIIIIDDEYWSKPIKVADCFYLVLASRRRLNLFLFGRIPLH